MIHCLSSSQLIIASKIILLFRIFFYDFKHIILCWLPSHTGIEGNEKADIAAKSALLLPPSNFKLPYTYFKPIINKYLFNKWQSVWDTAVDNKLHSIKPIQSEWRPAYRMDRKEEVVLTRLRIGHSYATHSYLLKGEEQPMCIPSPLNMFYFIALTSKTHVIDIIESAL